MDSPLALRELCRYTCERSLIPTVVLEGAAYVVRYANPAFCRLCGQEEAALLGRRLAEFLPPETADGCLALLDRVSLSRAMEEVTEREHGTAEGRTIYGAYAAWPVYEAKEGLSALLLQVTGREQAQAVHPLVYAISQALLLSGVRQHEQIEAVEAEGQRLRKAMRETDHRVKNNLQTLGALLNVQMMAHTEAVPVEDLNRILLQIKTLASIHNLLTRDVKGTPASVVLSVGALLEELLPMWRQLIGAERLAWSVEEVRLPVKQGISLAVVTNELISNAIKHGGSNVRLCLVASAGRVTLEVCDDGPGFPMPFLPGEHAHLGLDLIESISRVDLRGETVYTNRPEGGARVTITFPFVGCGQEETGPQDPGQQDTG